MVKFKGKSYKGIHEPIIRPELYYTVQDIFAHSGRNNPSFRRSPFKAATLLSGLVYCGKCGARYHGEHGNYSCYSRTKGDKKYIVDPNCKNKKWKIPELDTCITEYISRLSFEDIPEKKESQPPCDYSPRIAEIDKQIANLIDLYQIGGIPMEEISARIGQLTREKESLTEKMRETQEKPITREDYLKCRNKFLDLLEDGDLQEKRACLTNMISRITLTDDQIDIELK